jgi:SET domain-containing protein
MLDSNSFKLDGGCEMRAVYVTASLINHDCAPNCRVKVAADLSVHVYAKRDIRNAILQPFL